jgi:Na+/proline symporter
MFVVRISLYLALVLYAPALAIGAVTDVPIWASVLSCGTVATLYTMKGGMSSVIWTDFLQVLASAC